MGQRISARVGIAPNTVSPTHANTLTPINLNFPEFGKSLKMQGSPDIKKEVERIFQMMALQFGKN